MTLPPASHQHSKPRPSDASHKPRFSTQQKATNQRLLHFPVAEKPKTEGNKSKTEWEKPKTEGGKLSFTGVEAFDRTLATISRCREELSSAISLLTYSIYSQQNAVLERLKRLEDEIMNAAGQVKHAGAKFTVDEEMFYVIDTQSMLKNLRSLCLFSDFRLVQETCKCIETELLCEEALPPLPKPLDPRFNSASNAQGQNCSSGSPYDSDTLVIEP